MDRRINKPEYDKVYYAEFVFLTFLLAVAFLVGDTNLVIFAASSIMIMYLYNISSDIKYMQQRRF
ncbi:MAG: hypothetical protein ACOCP4_04935 [Candidatus Woesearchaeota archaeon]